MYAMSPALTSCQYVAGHILETSASSPLNYFSIIPVLLLIKIVLSLLAQRLHVAEISDSNKHVPSKLNRLRILHQIPQQRILFTNQPSLEAYVVGVLNTRIVLSRNLVRVLTSKQLEAVLLHELFHFKHLHPVIFMVSSAISSICWFLPIVGEVSRIVQERCEVAADQFAIQVQGTERFLLRALRTCLQDPLRNSQHQYAAAIVPTLQTQLLQQRINSLTTREPAQITSLRHRSILSSVAVVLVLCALAFLKPTFTVTAQAPNQCTFAECVARCMSEQVNYLQRKPSLENEFQSMSSGYPE